MNDYKKDYYDYIQSQEWYEIRNKVMTRDHGLCQGCLAAPAEEVHHFTYENVKKEFCWQLTSLCRKCHCRVHGKEYVENKSSKIEQITTISPDRIVEHDFLRWLLIMSDNIETYVNISRKNLNIEDLHLYECQKIYRTILETIDQKRSNDLLSIMISVDDFECQSIITEIMEKKVNKERADQNFFEAIQRILDRNWMKQREEIRKQIQSGNVSDDEVQKLVSEFEKLKGNPPKVNK